MKKFFKFISILLIIYLVIFGILNIRVYNVPRFETFEEQMDYADELFSQKREFSGFLKYYLDLGWKRPLIAYKKLVEWYPEESNNTPELYGALGECYERVKNYKMALRCYYKDIEIIKKMRPNNYLGILQTMYESIANVSIYQKKYDEAIESYKKAMLEFPDDNDKERRLALYHFTYQIANIYNDDIKDKAKGSEWYKKAAEIRPY